MRRAMLIALAAAAALAVTGWAARGAASGPEPARAAATVHPAADRQAETAWAQRVAAGQQHTHQHAASPAGAAERAPGLADQLARARLATATYATNLHAAKADGYQLITRMIPDMGWHYLNPTVQGFDITRPPILVYERHGRRWQLAALEWVFTEQPATPPLPGATYGSFAAACHYTDGTFVPAPSQELCATRSPQTGARFTFWHPDLVTLHLWLWYPNPDGLYNGTNPFIRPFNHT